MKNAQIRKFELKMQLIQLKQKNQKLIFDYIKRTSNISRKLSNDEIDVEMTILRNMKNVSKKKQINFECQKKQNYNFIVVNKLIKTIYNEINKFNSFDSKYKKTMQMMLFHTTNFDQINDELLKQILINSNQVFSTMLQTLRSLNFNFDQFTSFDQRKSTNTQQNDKNFAHIICYICKQSNHYVSHCSNQSNQTFKITKIINHAMISINQIQFQRQTRYSFVSNQSFFSNELIRLNAIFNQSFHSQIVNKSQHESKSTMSNVVILTSSLSILKKIKMKNYHIDDENNDRNFFSSMICILSTQKSYLITIMTAQNAKSKQKTNQTTTISFFEIKKSKFRLNSSAKISKKSVKYVFNAKNQNDDEKNKKIQKSKKMNISRNEIDNDEFTFIYQSTSQSIFWKDNRSFFSQLFQSISQNSTQYEFRNSSSIKLNKKENLTHLISYKFSKILDFIRNLLEINRFNVNIIMNLFLILSLKQFLDKFDVIKLKLTESMQKSIAKYRVRKTNEQNRNQQKTTTSLIMTITKTKTKSSIIIVHVHENNEQSQSLMIIFWINNVKLSKTLINEKSMMKLINRQKFLIMKFAFFVRTNDHFRINLITNHVETFTNYIVFFVNVEKIKIVIKTYIVNNQIYDLLLNISWMKKIIFNSHYDTNEIIIIEKNEKKRKMSTQIFSIHVDLSTIKMNNDDEINDLIDVVCQLFLNEQLNWIRIQRMIIRWNVNVAKLIKIILIYLVNNR